MSLETGQRLSRQQWDEVPMPEGVVAKVEAMATEKEQPTAEEELIFEWAPIVPIDDILVDINIHQLDEE